MSLLNIMTNSDQKIIIRKANDHDFNMIRNIFHGVIQSMDTYAFYPNTSKESAYKIWMHPDNQTYAALINNEIIGTYYLKPNQIGLGSHIANAAYMVDPNKQGLGIGKTMAPHSIEEAKKVIILVCNSILSSAPMNQR